MDKGPGVYSPDDLERCMCQLREKMCHVSASWVTALGISWCLIGGQSCCGDLSHVTVLQKVTI